MLVSTIKLGSLSISLLVRDILSSKSVSFTKNEPNTLPELFFHLSEASFVRVIAANGTNLVKFGPFCRIRLLSERPRMLAYHV